MGFARGSVMILASFRGAFAMLFVWSASMIGFGVVSCAIWVWLGSDMRSTKIS